jgi:hypothetical protein
LRFTPADASESAVTESSPETAKDELCAHVTVSKEMASADMALAAASLTVEPETMQETESASAVHENSNPAQSRKIEKTLKLIKSSTLQVNVMEYSLPFFNWLALMVSQSKLPVNLKNYLNNLLQFALFPK